MSIFWKLNSICKEIEFISFAFTFSFSLFTILCILFGYFHCIWMGRKNYRVYVILLSTFSNAHCKSQNLIAVFNTRKKRMKAQETHISANLQLFSSDAFLFNIKFTINIFVWRTFTKHGCIHTNNWQLKKRIYKYTLFTLLLTTKFRLYKTNFKIIAIKMVYSYLFSGFIQHFIFMCLCVFGFISIVFYVSI